MLGLKDQNVYWRYIEEHDSLFAPLIFHWSPVAILLYRTLRGFVSLVNWLVIWVFLPLIWKDDLRVSPYKFYILYIHSIAGSTMHKTDIGWEIDILIIDACVDVPRFGFFLLQSRRINRIKKWCILLLVFQRGSIGSIDHSLLSRMTNYVRVCTYITPFLLENRSS